MTRTMRTTAALAALAAGALLQGCSQEAGPAARSKLPVYAADVQGGAKVCSAPTAAPAAGQTSTVAMTVGNDGGWCGILTHQEGQKPYAAGLLTTRPAHGGVTVHSVGDSTRIDYVPDRGYAGPDSFAVKLLPGDSTVQVNVTVTQPQA